MVSCSSVSHTYSKPPFVYSYSINKTAKLTKQYKLEGNIDIKPCVLSVTRIHFSVSYSSQNQFIYPSSWNDSGQFCGTQPTSLCFGLGLALAAVPSLGLVASPKGGILSSPQNFNLVCLGCFAVEAEEPKPRLNMRDKRPANSLSLAEGRRRGEATANRHCPFLSMNQGFSPLQGQAASKQWCYPEQWKSSCLDVLIGRLNGLDQWQRGVEFFCLIIWLCVHIVLGGCGPTPNIHRNYIMFDLVRSGFYLVGIQRFGLELELEMWRETCWFSVQFIFRCWKYLSLLVFM